MKIAVNRCFGGFDLSDKACERLIELGIEVCTYSDTPKTTFYLMDHEEDGWYGRYYIGRCEENRSHPLLIQVIEELGNDVNTSVSDIEIVEIPDGVEYIIDDYDGMETVHEVHRSW